jgi:hypothetical protein
VMAQATSVATSVATSTATSTATSSSTSKDQHQKTVAVATAVSTGGKATAVSHAVNGSSIQTTAVATGKRRLHNPDLRCTANAKLTTASCTMIKAHGRCCFVARTYIWLLCKVIMTTSVPFCCNPCRWPRGRRCGQSHQG